MTRYLSFSLLLFCVACGGNKEEPGIIAADARPITDPDVDPNAKARITGTVWMPGNGPGANVPEGHEIPVFDAVIYLTSERPEPLHDGATCRPCIEAPATSVQSDHNGNFTLSNVNEGTYWLVIEKGDFRLEQEITVAKGKQIALEPAQTTLPSVNDWTNGKTIPRIALAVGEHDHLESLLGKMGIGEVDNRGAFVSKSAAGAFDLYRNDVTRHDDVRVGTLDELVKDLDRMLKYDLIFIPCATGFQSSLALQDIQVLRNIRDYVAAGGKLYVTDWSGEWVDNVFPEQVQLFGKWDTPAEAYDRESDTWNVGLFANANQTGKYTSYGAVASNDDLRMWLDGQQSPLPLDMGSGVINPNDLTLIDNYVEIEGLHSVEIGVDEEDKPVVDTPKKYVIGPSRGAAKRPLTVTYEPAGCGRVLYSTYHTTQAPHLGAYPQERILMYLIMEIGVCKDVIVID